jgi:hypothetical protein
MVKGGVHYMFKYTAFSGLILGGSMAIQAYRNKTSVLDFTAGGALAGALLRMHYGLANVVVGGMAGAVFGTIIGAVRTFELTGLGQTYECDRLKKLEERIITRE